MGNKKATGFLCLRLVPCFAYVGAEDNRKGIPFVKIVSLLCKLIQFLMVALSVTVHKALILLVFLNHPHQSLAFGSFLAQLRREKGMTQKELAACLYVSDKAVSKWERGLSVPDISLLVPLAEQLNVTVAELLQGCRVEEEQRFTREETEELIRKALIFSAEPPERRQARTQKFLPLYGVSVVLGLVETAAVWAVGLAGTEGAMMLLIINVIFGIVYGAYTLFWMPETLPRYYDENHVCNFAQGAFHMHIPGVYYNNRNWLHVLKAMRVWCVVSMLLTPLCTAAAVVFEQATGWQVWGAVLIGYIASLFGAIVIPAKKYQ